LNTQLQKDVYLDLNYEQHNSNFFLHLLRIPHMQRHPAPARLGSASSACKVRQRLQLLQVSKRRLQRVMTQLQQQQRSSSSGSSRVVAAPPTSSQQALAVLVVQY
jgi:hypothetical protein